MKVDRDERPMETLLRFYEAEARYMGAREAGETASFAEFAETLAENVVLHQSPDLPFGGEYRGHRGYEAWAIAMSAIFDRLEVKEREFFESGDKVVVVCRLVTRSRRNGSVQDLPMVQVVTAHRGKITDFRPFYWNVPAYVGAVEDGGVGVS